MRLNELREIVKGLTHEQLSRLFVELYRASPKAALEKARFDAYIRDPPREGEKRPKPPSPPAPDLESLRDEAEEFMRDAHAQHYFAPNRFIPKQDRPKWRFIVMRLYKDLQKAAAQGPAEGKEAADLLLRLYELMGKAREVVLFGGSDPFESVRITQEDFFRSILALKERILPSADFVEFAVVHSTTKRLNQWVAHKGLTDVAVAFFKTPDAKEQALEVCRRLRRETKAISYGKEHKRDDLNALTDMVFAIHWSLRDYDPAIADFNANAIHDNAEIRLLVLIANLFHLGQKDLLLREYGEAMARGIQPRDELKKLVKTIQETGHLPQYFL